MAASAGGGGAAGAGAPVRWPRTNPSATPNENANVAASNAAKRASESLRTAAAASRSDGLGILLIAGSSRKATV